MSQMNVAVFQYSKDPCEEYEVHHRNQRFDFDAVSVVFRIRLKILNSFLTVICFQEASLFIKSGSIKTIVQNTRLTACATIQRT